MSEAREVAEAVTPAAEPSASAGAPVASAPLARQILRLQRTAGNQATGRLLARGRVLQRQHTGAVAPVPAAARGAAMEPEDMFNKLIGHILFEDERYGHIPGHRLEDTKRQLDSTKRQLEAMEERLKVAPTPALRNDYQACKRDYQVLKQRYDLSFDPSRLGTEPSGMGAGAASPRPGYNTSAIIQVVDKDGRLVEVAFGDYDSAGHAEEHAINSLRRQLGGRKVPGGRVEVVGDRIVCADVCRPALEKFAKEVDADRVDGHVFQRPVVKQAPGTPPRYASEKTTMKTLTKATSEGKMPRRVSGAIYERPGSPPRPAGGGGSPGRPSSGSLDLSEGVGTGRFAGTALSIGAPLAQTLWMPWFKEKMLHDLEALPKPVVDQRRAGPYFRDPKTRDAVTTLDVLGKNIPEFTREMDAHAARTITTANLELAATALMSEAGQAAYERRIERIDAINEQLSAYEEDLLTIRDNLDALLDQEPRAMETRKAADDLRALLENPVVAGQLLERGYLSPEELSQSTSNLAHLSVSLGMTFADARTCRAAIDLHVAEIQKLHGGVRKIWWMEFGEQFEAHLEERRAAERRVADRLVGGAGVRPAPAASGVLNADQRGMQAYYNTKDAEIRMELGKLGDPSEGEDAGKAQRRAELIDQLRELQRRREQAGL